MAAPLALLALSALGCSAELEQYSSDADVGSTHALITIQRSASADGATTRADALAGFVRVPADVESKPLYDLLGLKPVVPPLGQCRARSAIPEATPPLTPMGSVELLPVGEVLLAVSGAESALAPHAFPTVTDSISGVVYTSRDRTPEALPALARYEIRTAGADSPAIHAASDAPAELESVTVGGQPLAEVSEISSRDPIDITWAVGTPGDLVVVVLASSDGVNQLSCTFRDDSGAGTIVAGAFTATGPGRLSLHRLRTQTFVAPGVDVGEIGFDFQLGTNVSFGQ